MGRLGIGEGDVVIAYDDSGGGTAGRLVWMLHVIGQPATLLDGGLQAWPEPPETGDGVARPPTTVPPRPWPADRFASHEEIATAAEGPHAVVLDRAFGAPLRRRGLVGRSAARTHPGRRQRAVGRQPRPEQTGRFRDAAALRQRFADLGVEEDTEVICYCGSGVSACADLLALERAGVGHTRLYVPSWSGWSADPARPAARGRE